MKHRAVTLLLTVLFCTPALRLFAADTGSKPAAKAAVLALAAKYIGYCEPRLQGKDFISVSDTKLALSSRKGEQLQETIDDLVNQMTISLAGLKSLDALTVGSAYLVKAAPDNPRTTNLLASVLEAYGKAADAIVILEYTVALAPRGTLAMLSLANAYLNADQDEKAKALLDRVVLFVPGSSQVHQSLATYWYKKGNRAKLLEELMKAATCGGIVQRKAQEEDAKTAPEEVQTGDSLDKMEAKCDGLKDHVPFTTADIIEGEFPEVARQIRDRYGRLAPGELRLLPKLPQMKVNELKDYKESYPFADAWMNAFAEKNKDFSERVLGLSPGASDEAVSAAAEAQANEQIAAAMKTANEQLEALKNTPGLSAADRAELEQAVKDAQALAGKDGATGAAPAAQQRNVPDGDYGGIFSDSNYYIYRRIAGSYERYLTKLLHDCDTKLSDIMGIYTKKVRVEDKQHEAKIDEIGKQLKNNQNQRDIATAREILRHKRAINTLGDDYYKQWVNLYMPRYAQKMKPALDQYWAVSTLYIKNMADPTVMKREYLRINTRYLIFASQAVSGLGSGDAFQYLGPTDEEEEALRQAIQAAEEAAREKTDEYRAGTQMPDDAGWSKWIEDHLVVDVAGEFLALKVTARTIEFEAWAYGPTGRVKWDVIDGKLTTYSGITAKVDFGINICGVGGKVKGKADIIGQTATFDLDHGGYKEGYPETSAEGKLTLGPVSGAVKGSAVLADSGIDLKGAYKLSLTQKAPGL
jgi:hypothetical protein